MEGSFISQITLCAADFAPQGFLACNGALLPISGSSAYLPLFSLLGTKFGGDGYKTFGLPNLPAPAGLLYIICVQGSFPVR